MKATEVLRRDHAVIDALIDELVHTDDDQRRRELLVTLAAVLEIHIEIEEELFYPPLAARSGVVPEARRHHAQIRNAMRDIARWQPTAPDFWLEVGQLRDAVHLHILEEEQRVFPEAEQLGADELEALGQRLEERRQAEVR